MGLSSLNLAKRIRLMACLPFALLLHKLDITNKIILYSSKTLIMKSIWLIALSICLNLPNLQAQDISIEAIPTNMDQFLEIRAKLAQTPQGGAAVFILSMLLYEREPELGMQAFTIALDRHKLAKNNPGYKGYVPDQTFQNNVKSYLAPRSYIARSYILGTSPEQGYQMGKPPYKMQFSSNAHSEQSDGSMRIFIKSSGADSPRPVTLKKNNRGIWKVSNYSSLFMGIRSPATEIDDDL